MKASLILTLTVLAAVPVRGALAQAKVQLSGGEIVRENAPRRDTRLFLHVPGVDEARRERVRVTGDSAQRIAMNLFAWQGRVNSVEFDEADTRLFWDVKIVPDSSNHTIIRYRIDAANGGVIGVKEFGGLSRLARKP